MSVETERSGRVCPHCASPIPAEAPGQLCARCLLHAAATETDAIPSKQRPSPPSIAEVAAAFPDFEVLSLAGVGGMGFVYRVRNRTDGRESALKLLPADLAATPAFVERFEREARTLARLHHPNIVAVHGFGRTADFCYLLMEFIDGANLRQAMRSSRFNPAETLALVPQLCDALQYAHSQGVLHRDIKPENILLDPRGVPKVADFGIAKLLGDHASPDHLTLTQTGQRVGTPHYMAPEQIERPDSVDHRADIYSLGVVLYELLTGELPLGRFPAPSLKAALDARIDDIVFRALSKERELRQQSASQVRHEVESLESKPPTPPPASPARAAACYVTTPAHLRSLKGHFHAFPHDGSLRLEAGQLVFTSPEQTWTIALDRITGLSLGKLPWFVSPGIEYVAVRFVMDGNEQCLLLTPHESNRRLAPAQGLAQEWETAIRDAVAAAGLPEVPAIDRAQLGEGPRQKLRSLALALVFPAIGVTAVAYADHRANAALHGGGLQSMAIIIASGLVGCVLLVMLTMLLVKVIHYFRSKSQGHRRVLRSILVWNVLPLILALLPYLFFKSKPMASPHDPTVSAGTQLRLLFRLIDAASNRLGVLPPSLQAFGETAIDPGSGVIFSYTGHEAEPSSQVLAFSEPFRGTDLRAVLFRDGSVQHLQDGAFWQVYHGDLPEVGRTFPPDAPAAEIDRVLAQGRTLARQGNPPALHVLPGSMAEVFWMAAHEVSSAGKPHMALQLLDSVGWSDAGSAQGGGDPFELEFAFAGHRYRMSRAGVLGVRIMLAAHAGDLARLQQAQALLRNEAEPDPREDRVLRLFERSQPADAPDAAEIVEVRLGELLRAVPSQMVRANVLRRSPGNPTANASSETFLPWTPRL